MTTQTTLGSLIATLFEEYERRDRDSRLAAIATQLAIANLSTNRNASTWESLQAASS